MRSDQVSRRSFLKKTTVLAVAAANVSLFSGLVNAAGGSGSGGGGWCNGGIIMEDCRWENGYALPGWYCEVNCGGTLDPESWCETKKLKGARTGFGKQDVWCHV